MEKLKEWIKLREENVDEWGEILCYCGHTFKCGCSHPDLETFNDSIKNGTLDPYSSKNNWVKKEE